MSYICNFLVYYTAITYVKGQKSLVYGFGDIMKLRSTFLAWISNYIDRVTDIIKAKLLGDFHLVC